MAGVGRTGTQEEEKSRSRNLLAEKGGRRDLKTGKRRTRNLLAEKRG
jgi:hypothetical protein